MNPETFSVEHAISVLEHMFAGNEDGLANCLEWCEEKDNTNYVTALPS